MKRIRIVAILALAALAAGCGGRPEYRPQNGDLIFHTSTSEQSAAIQAVTGSPITHVGIVWLDDGVPRVLEAVGPVKATDLQEWIARGKDGRYAVKRLAPAAEPPTEADWQRLHAEYERLRGKPYDPCFAWDDDAMYCSEFVYKAYRRGLRIMLTNPRPLTRYDLSDPAVQTLIARTCPEGLDEYGWVVAPVDLYTSPKLVTVVDDFAND